MKEFLKNIFNSLFGYKKAILLDELINSIQNDDLNKLKNLFDKSHKLNLNAHIKKKIQLELEGEATSCEVHTLLTYAACLGYVQIVELLLEQLKAQHAVIKLSWDLDPFPVLLYLVNTREADKLKCAEFLIEAGVPVDISIQQACPWEGMMGNSKNSKESALLLAAMQSGHENLIELMIRKGARLSSEFMYSLQGEARPSEAMIKIWEETR